MKNYKLTLIGSAIAGLLLICTFSFDLDIFEVVIASLHSTEHFEIDEFIIPFGIIAVFTYLDQRRRQKLKMLENEKIKIYKAMLASNYHILNNFLNQIQLFKLTAQKTPDFNPRVLALYDKIVESAKTQLEALASIQQVNESSITESVAPKQND